MEVRRPVRQVAPRQERQPSRPPAETERTSAKRSSTSSCENILFTVNPLGGHLSFPSKIFEDKQCKFVLAVTIYMMCKRL